MSRTSAPIRPGPLVLLALVVAFAFAACGRDERDAGHGAARVLRIGHFPNVTHAHGLVAHALTRAQRGWIEERVGPDVEVQWFTYNAGPSAMEALLSGDLDLAYVGPSPALNAYVRSRGDDVRVLAAATWGGTALVVQGDGRIARPEDFRGKTVATPQLGNTQDVSCRAWLTAQGFRVTQTGGDVKVVPAQNADQLDLFARGHLDAVWTVEPWVSRLETEAKGKVYLEEPDALTTVLVAGTKFLRRDPALARAVVAAHHELTEWMQAHGAEARELVRAELHDEMKREIDPALVERCWKRMHFDDGISTAAFQVFVQSAQSAGFLKDAGDLARLVERLQ